MNGYLLVNDPDCLKSNSIKMRIGLKCVGFFFENEGLLERNQTFIEKLDPKNCFNIQKMMKASKEINVWEAAKIVLNLSQFELNKLNLLFENFDNVQSVFSNDIGEHLTQERKIEGYEVRKELLKVYKYIKILLNNMND